MKQDEGLDHSSVVVNHGSEMTVVISNGEEESLPHRSEEKIYHPLSDER